MQKTDQADNKSSRNRGGTFASKLAPTKAPRSLWERACSRWGRPGRKKCMSVHGRHPLVR